MYAKHKPGQSTPFYDALEPGIREVVRLLRDHGINTICSCEHDMVVEADAAHAEAAELAYQTLVNHGYDGFRIEFVLRKSPGFPDRTLIVHLGEDAYIK